ncbi:RecJ like exonuclease [Halobacteriales archaeon QH_10_67_13]|nr:MAG: RecJ like exonuclease [Halobacteriales archaeon QH_10_67_13]
MTPPNDADDPGGSPAATVYDLAPECTAGDLEVGERYLATVNGVVDYGVFVDVSEAVSGLVHSSELTGSYDVDDELLVELEEIRENGDLSFSEVQPAEYDVTPRLPGTLVDGTDLAAHVGTQARLEGQVVQVKQTGGPTIFQVSTGAAVVPCAAFEAAGERAFPAVGIDDVVRVLGTVEARAGAHQIEADTVRSLEGTDRDRVAGRVEETRAEVAAPDETETLIEWPAFEPIAEELTAVARRLREAVLRGRPIRLRHHADGDGLCAGVPLQHALKRFIAQRWVDSEAPQHLLKRLPSKAPFYELEDATRDLNFALESRRRHGQKLPLFLMLDNGSTEEDTPAYRSLAHYDIPILVVDHAIVVEVLVADAADALALLLGVLSHQADAMEAYLELAAEAGYDETRLREVGEALDYATHWLRYNAGREFVYDLLNVNCEDRERHEELVDLLAERASADVDRQLSAAEQHVVHERLDNGAHLYRIDVDEYAKRFTYPAPGKTTGKIHDRKVAETGDPVITIGYGPDFAVLRSDGVRLDIPEMVAELKAETDGGVSGGGHLVVGSIQFVSGMRGAVLEALIEKMAGAKIDESLGSSAVVAE